MDVFSQPCKYVCVVSTCSVTGRTRADPMCRLPPTPPATPWGGRGAADPTAATGAARAHSTAPLDPPTIRVSVTRYYYYYSSIYVHQRLYSFDSAA